MTDGRVAQIGTPFEIYNSPRTRFVASFVGTLNILQGRVIDAATGRLAIDDQEIGAARAIAGAQSGETRSVALRPEAVSLSDAGEHNRLSGTVEEVSFLGAIVRIRVRLKESAISFDTFNNPNVPPPGRGKIVTIGFTREDVLVLESGEAG